MGADISSPLDTDNDGIIDVLDLDDDNDGLSTQIESRIGTSPLLSDTDGDGVADSDEVGSNPKSPLDTDGDGIINALDTDDDDDGLETASELIYGTNILLADSDGDGLTDAQEIGGPYGYSNLILIKMERLMLSTPKKTPIKTMMD